MATPSNHDGFAELRATTFGPMFDPAEGRVIVGRAAALQPALPTLLALATVDRTGFVAALRAVAQCADNGNEAIEALLEDVRAAREVLDGLSEVMAAIEARLLIAATVLADEVEAATAGQVGHA